MAFSLSDAVALLALVIALYGAGLSSYMFFVQQREKKPHIRVEFTYKWRGKEKGAIGIPSVAVSVINEGFIPTTLDEVRIWARVGVPFSLLPGDTRKLPVEVLPGKKYESYIPVREVREKLAAVNEHDGAFLRAVCRDQVDRAYRSNPLHFNCKAAFAHED